MVVGAGTAGTAETGTEPEESSRWAMAWRTWLSIGQKVTVVTAEAEEAADTAAPTQAFLTALYHIFPLLHPHIKTRLGPGDVARLAQVTTSCLALPVQADSELGFLLTVHDDSLLPLHTSIVKCVAAIESHALAASPALLPPVFSLYLQLSKLVHTWPAGAHQCAVKGMFPEKYILFGERALLNIGRLYERTHSMAEVAGTGLLQEIVTTVRTPLHLKYKCIKQSSWRIAMEVLLSVLTSSLQDTRDKDQHSEVWAAVTETLDTFLFPSVKPPSDRSPDQLAEDEAIDCSVIEFLKNKVLDQPSLFPHSFILSIMVILNKGSIHSHYNGEDLNKNQESVVVITMR